MKFSLKTFQHSMLTSTALTASMLHFTDGATRPGKAPVQ